MTIKITKLKEEIEMAVETTTVNEYTKIIINVERLDVSSMEEIKTAIANFIEGKSKVLLDLSNVNFLDSSGLSVLIGTLKKMNKLEDSSLILCGLTTQPNELMQITQLHNVFNIIEDCSKI